jgi:outer membrane protein TolC
VTAPATATAPAPATPAGPLTLAQAVRLALTRNERAGIADLDVAVAEAAVSRARSEFLPALSASGNDTLRPRSSPVAVVQGALTLNQPLVVPPAFPLYAQAKHALEGQRAQRTDDRRQLAFDAAHAYVSVLLAEQVVEAAQRKLDTAQADVADTEAQSKAQLVSSNDVTRAQISLAGSQRELAADRGNLEAAYVQLELVVAARVARQLAEPTALLAAGERPLPPSDQLVHDALDHRPALTAKRAQALARSIEAEVRTAAAQLASAQQALVAARAARDASRKGAKETEILYRQGLARAIELTDANGKKFDAEVSRASAKLSMEQAYLELRFALGYGPVDE